MAKHALVVKRDMLFQGDEFQGFLSLKERDLVSVILNNHFYHPRGDELENDSSLKQVIPYIWIVSPGRKEVFLYKRKLNATDKANEYKEERYLNKYSGGVGGHIDQDTEGESENPITQAMMRELKEEVEMEGDHQPRFFGYINDDSDSIGKVHFGLVALVESDGKVKAKAEEGLEEGKFYSIEEADRLMNDSMVQKENWTNICWPFVRDYLLNLK